MVYTVTFTPSIDYIVTVNSFELGMTNRTTSEQLLPGGKGVNVSAVLERLGVPSTALGYVAGFTGEQIEAMLSQQGVHTEFIHLQTGNSRINIKLKSIDGTEINGMGPEISQQDIDALTTQIDQLQADDILVLAGSIPAGMSKSIYGTFMERVKEKGICVAVDTTQEMLRNVLPHNPFIIKPNQHELGELLGVPITTPQQALQYGEQLLQAGAQNAIVSMGKEGAVFLGSDGQRLHLAAPKGTLVNSVGAGDSMLAGFLAGYLKTNDLAFAFKMAVCTGSASAFSKEFATAQEVEKLMCQR